MDRLFDRLGDLLRTVLGGDAGTTTGSGRRPGRPSHIDDPDLAAAWDELEDYLDADAPASGAAGTGRQHRPGDAGAGRRTARKDPRDHLRADYETLGVPFGAPMSDVRRAYKRLMRAQHPDRFANDPGKQAAATRKAARINDAYARIERDQRPA